MHLFVNVLLVLILMFCSVVGLTADTTAMLLKVRFIESNVEKTFLSKNANTLLTAPDFDFGVVDPVCGNNQSGSLSVVHFDLPPVTYSYAWSNGATTQTINNLSAGNYTVTVTNVTTSANAIKSIELFSTTTKPLLNLTCADEILNTYNLSADIRCVNNNGRVFKVGNLLDNYYKAYGCPGLPGMNPWPEWLKMQSGLLTEYANGTARLTMTVFSECDTTLRFTVQAQLSDKVNSSGDDPLTNDQCTALPLVDNNWFYYRDVKGYMIGLNQLSGGVVYFDILNGTDYPAQFGSGGSGTSQFGQFGSESWNKGYIVSSPTSNLPFLLKSGINRRMDWRFAFAGPLQNLDPYCNQACSGANTTLQSNSFSPFPLTYLWSNGATTANISVTPSSTTTYSVSVSDTHGCISSESFTINVSNTIPAILSTVQASRCGSGSVTLAATPSSGNVRWYSNVSGGSILHTGTTFTTPVINSTTTYYAEAINAGCVSNTRTAVIATINEATVANISGNLNICQGSTTTLTASGGTTYLWQDGSTQSSIVVATHASYTVTVSNISGCTSSASVFVNINSNPAISLDYDGQLCLTDFSQLSVNINSGVAPFTFSWTGPSGFTSMLQSFNIINSGNYYVTVTDGNNCTSNINGLVYERYDPFISAITNEICVGESVVLSVSSPSAISYLWSANATSASSGSVSVFPGFPSSLYQVTVTNDIGCTAVPSVSINVKQRPTVAITGPTAICAGQQTSLSPNTGGTWTSNNPSVATVSNIGVVTGISGGTAAFIFTSDTTGCPSLPTQPVTINAKPNATIIGPSNICLGSTSQAGPNGNGIWISSNPSFATINNDGLITGVGIGAATFTFTNSTTGCVSDPTTSINVSQPINITLDGPNTVCVQSTITILPSASGGNWSSSNNSIAYVNEFGMVVGFNPGNAMITYTYQIGPCSEIVNKMITVLPQPTVNISGASILCTGETTFLTPSTGGTWTSSAPNVASISINGEVTALTEGTANFIFTLASTGCASPPTASITVNSKPIINVIGSSTICIGGQTNLTPANSGIWISGNPTVASINNLGIVIGLKSGTARFIFISSNGCASDSSALITVGSKPNLSVDYNGSVCLTDNSVLSVLVSNGTSPFSFTWTGPLGFTNNTSSFNVTSNGTYQVTVTDILGCSNVATAFINQRYEPIILGPSSSICEGQSVNLQVSASNAVAFLWSDNAGNSTSQNVFVLPSVPSSSYTVTVSNSLGCTASVTTNVVVNPKPILTLTGNDSICIGSNTTFIPSNGGTWLSSNPSVANIANNGVVTGISAGTATFTFTDFNLCTSNPSVGIIVNSRPTTTVLGPNVLCQGSFVNLSPISGGVWTSSNPSIATVTNTGLVTGINQGTAFFSFTNSQTGCVSNSNLSISVLNRPSVFINGDDNVCAGSNTQLHPGSGGIWISSDLSVANVTNNGLVTGISGGIASFTFTENSSGCSSLPTSPITVHNRPNISLTGPTNLCIGETSTLTPSSGGFWISSNPTVATITNTGVVTAKAMGTATFIFTDFTNFCSSLESTSITVHPKPVVSILGSNNICIGQTTSLSPSVGGTWISNNPAIATVSNDGTVTAISPGVTTFRFTNTTTGCVSFNTSSITVNALPIVALEGPGQICLNSTTSLSPVSGGTWSSNNPTIANVNNAGLVTGLTTGTVSFTFTETSTGCTAMLPTLITVNPIPTVQLIGPDSICIGSTTQFLPSSGGIWISMNPNIASISSSGIVTGLNSGAARFYFVNALTACPSTPSIFIIINEKPAITPNTLLNLCQGQTSTLTISGSGSWVSSNEAVATVNNLGVITAISPGFARFVFTNGLTGCKSDSSDFVQVNSPPSTFLNGPASICAGNTTQLAPTIGGVWNALDPSIATINNAGLVDGLSQGTARFTFTQTSTGCTSTSTISITILPLPIVSISGGSEICIGENTTLSPTSGGTWQSLNSTIGSVHTNGLVSGLSQGLANFRFTATGTGCSAITPSPVKVNGKPIVSIQGASEICIGSQTQLSPVSEGVWSSENSTIATVTNDGIVTGVSLGTVRFIFTNTTTLCSSDYTQPVEISAPKQISNIGSDIICLGYKTQLNTGYPGIWESSDSLVLTVNGAGEVSSVAPGKANIIFTETATGCVSTLAGEGITVIHCLDPDFNVTFVNHALTGNISTNDDVPTMASYGIPMVSNKPADSNQTLTLNPNGEYTFVGDKIGIYEYNVPVCTDVLTSPCPFSLLTITVIDPYDHAKTIVSNTDFTTTYKLGNSVQGQQVQIATLYNDACMNEHLCYLNPTGISFPSGATKGIIYNNAGTSIYTPNIGLTGQETIVYSVCSQENPGNCVTARQIITINAQNAINTVVGVDDFKVGMKGQSILCNVLINDYDPEGNNLSVIAQGNAGAPVVIPAGSYFLQSDGLFVFNPAPSFIGPLDIVYTVCDDNLTSFCTKATIHLLVLPHLRIYAKVYLEGSLMRSNNTIGPNGMPLMRDDLRKSPFTGLNYIPRHDPYSVATPYTNLASKFQHFGSGLSAEYLTIQDSLALFSVDNQDAIVDWVFVELRSKSNYNMLLATRSGLLQRDGDIIDIDGQSGLEFPGIRKDSVYIVVRHRNHFGVMSQKIAVKDFIDFTSLTTPLFDFGTSLNNGFNYTGLAQKKNVVQGYQAMWAGDFDGNGRLKFTNPNDDQNTLYFDVLVYPLNVSNTSNYNFVHGYLQSDYDMNSKSKYDNPNDDKNFLFNQILAYPLNYELLSNFNFLIQQVPAVMGYE